ncbi:hypothetical protein CPB83DRAFT_840867 [Crepidotus variabilis]|uniref:Uncharacterized protein n=1 Tax=Crepidotus variabilis TaxID=179855 RepID=A0A9P6E3P6_9AGAR|nr:hypothetical protein CPB83DRAFT_840867 [Crepidotus variabilis]
MAEESKIQGCLVEVAYPVDSKGIAIKPKDLARHVDETYFPKPQCFHGLPASLAVANPGVSGEPNVILICSVLDGYNLPCSFFINATNLLRTSSFIRYIHYQKRPVWVLPPDGTFAVPVVESMKRGVMRAHADLFPNSQERPEGCSLNCVVPDAFKQKLAEPLSLLPLQEMTIPKCHRVSMSGEVGSQDDNEENISTIGTVSNRHPAMLLLESISSSYSSIPPLEAVSFSLESTDDRVPATHLPPFLSLGPESRTGKLSSPVVFAVPREISQSI